MYSKVSLIYSIPYVVLLLTLFFFYLCERGKVRGISSKTSIVCAFIVVWFFIGGGYFLGMDWLSYYPFFESLPPLYRFNLANYSIGDYYGAFEIGFVLYSALMKAVFPDYFVWQFFNVAIDLAALIFVFRRYSVASVILPLIIWLSLYGFETEINQLRSSKAVALYMLSLRYIVDRKVFKFLLLVLLAYTFHHVSLIFIPTYFLHKRVLSLKWMILIFSIGTVVYFAGNVFFNVKLLGYFLPESDAQSAYGYIGNAGSRALSLSGIWDYISKLFLFCFLCLYYKYLGNKSSERLLYNLAFLSIVFALYFSFSYSLGHRLSLLFFFANAIILSKLYLACMKKPKYLGVSQIICLFCLASVCLENSSMLVRYENVLISSQSVEMRKREALKDASRYSGGHLRYETIWRLVQPK